MNMSLVLQFKQVQNQAFLVASRPKCGSVSFEWPTVVCMDAHPRLRVLKGLLGCSEKRNITLHYITRVTNDNVKSI